MWQVEEQHKVKVQPIWTASGDVEIQALCSCGVMIAQDGELDIADIQEVIGKHSIDVLEEVVIKAIGEGAALIGAELKKLAEKRKDKPVQGSLKNNK